MMSCHLDFVCGNSEALITNLQFYTFHHLSFFIILRMYFLLQTSTVPNGHLTDVPNGTNDRSVNGGNLNEFSNSHKVVMRRHSYMKDYNNSKKRNSFGFLNTLKRRPKPDRFSTFSQNSSIHVATPSDMNVTLQRKSPRKTGSFLRPGATLLRRKKHISEQGTNF